MIIHTYTHIYVYIFMYSDMYIYVYKHYMYILDVYREIPTEIEGGIWIL